MNFIVLSIIVTYARLSALQDNTPFAHRIKNAGRRPAAASVMAHTMASLRRFD
jgi:hypothetical protein